MNKQKLVNGQIDEPLAPEGIEQTKAITYSLPNSITHIYSSSLLRARQTVLEINSKLNLPYTFHDELSEIHMGVLAGKSWEAMKSGSELKDKHRSARFDYRKYGGESVKDVVRRLYSFLKKIEGQHRDYEALFVTHGGIIRILRLLDSGCLINKTENNLELLSFDLDRILKNA